MWYRTLISLKRKKENWYLGKSRRGSGVFLITTPWNLFMLGISGWRSLRKSVISDFLRLLTGSPQEAHPLSAAG